MNLLVLANGDSNYIEICIHFQQMKKEYSSATK